MLTAAHCIVPGEKLWVGDTIGGGSQRLPPSQLSAVDEIVQHPLFSSKDTGSPDLAILRLAKPLPDRFIPAVLSPRHLAEGDNLIAAGYGKASAEEARPSLVLRMVLLRVINAFRGWAILTSISEDRAGGAPGDSGGPLFTYRGMHTLVGLIVERLGQADQGCRARCALQLDQGDAGEAERAVGTRQASALTSPPPPPPHAG